MVLVHQDDLRVILWLAAADCKSFEHKEWEVFLRLAAKAGEPPKPRKWYLEALGKRVDGTELKIEAIKTWRAFTGYGLKEAKDAVEKAPIELPKVGGGEPEVMNNFVAELKACGAVVKLR